MNRLFSRCLTALMCVSLLVPQFSAAQVAIDPGARGAAAQAKSDVASLRQQGYRIVATNPAMYSSTTGTSATPVDVTWRTRHVAAVKAHDLRLVYGWFGGLGAASVSDIYNDGTISASFQKAGTTPGDQSGYLAQTWFPNGRTETAIGRGALVTTEPAFFDVDAGEAFYVNSHSSTFQPAAPPAPTLTDQATGGSLVAGATYNVSVVYVFPSGVESATSAGTAITLAAGANTRSISVASPSAASGAIGWRAYVTGRNAAIGGQYFEYPVAGQLGSAVTVTFENRTSNQRQARAGGLTVAPGGGYIFGGTNFAGLNTGEGQTAGDATYGGLTITQQASNLVYGPLAIIGKVYGDIPPTVALEGDSIMAGTGDQGYSYNGGFATRALNDQTSIRFSITKQPLYAYVRVPLGGEQARQFASTLNTNTFARSRLAVTTLADAAFSNYGNNDTSFGLADMQASILQIAKWHISRGQKFVQMTLMPNVTSVDGFTSVAGQTPKGTESVRLAFNAWLRDQSASGFVAQAGGDAYAKVIDLCKYTEVNAAGTLTINGGFWRVPPQTAYYTGSVTAVASSSQFTDSAIAGTAANTYMGYDVVFTSGALAGKSGSIFYQNGGVIDVGNAISAGVSPAIGDTYQIRLIPSADGLHPTSQGHVWAAQAVQEWLAANQAWLRSKVNYPPLSYNADLPRLSSNDNAREAQAA